MPFYPLLPFFKIHEQHECLRAASVKQLLPTVLMLTKKLILMETSSGSS